MIQREVKIIIILIHSKQGGGLELLFCSLTRILHCSQFMHCKMEFGESRLQFFTGYKQIIFWTITDDSEKHSVEYTDRYTKE